jgi:glutathione synthase/RimK-type ligase-like ATP-grasp enzyme
VVVQQWLPKGTTTARVLVVGRVVVAAATFRAPAGDWRSNAARGGTAESYRPSRDEARVAVAAAEALGLGHCGVDLTIEGEGPVILEVNPTPGFLHLEEATGRDVASEIVLGAAAVARL